jgi:hypothetical protein
LHDYAAAIEPTLCAPRSPIRPNRKLREAVALAATMRFLPPYQSRTGDGRSIENRQFS